MRSGRARRVDVVNVMERKVTPRGACAAAPGQRADGVFAGAAQPHRAVVVDPDVGEQECGGVAEPHGFGERLPDERGGVAVALKGRGVGRLDRGDAAADGTSRIAGRYSFRLESTRPCSSIKARHEYHERAHGVSAISSHMPT
jgi:hypothetical protein